MVKHGLVRAITGCGPYRGDDPRLLREENERLWRLHEQRFDDWVWQRIASLVGAVYSETCCAFERLAKLLLWLVACGGIISVCSVAGLACDRLAVAYGPDVDGWARRLRAEALHQALPASDAATAAVRIGWQTPSGRRLILRSPWLMALPVERRTTLPSPAISEEASLTLNGMLFPPDVELVEFPLVGWVSVAVQVRIGPADLQYELGDDG